MQDDYKQIKEEAKQFASQALERIEQENLPATPDIFELFYAYYSENNAEVRRSIDIMVSQDFELTVERCRELHKRLLDTDKGNETLARAEQIVGETIHDVGEMVDIVKSSNVEFSGSLNNIHRDISDAIDPSDFKKLLLSVLGETQKMIAENATLERKLEKSSSRMMELKQEMEAVREEAYIDALTGIANRKKFDVEVEHYVARAREQEKLLSAVFLDIDHFKSFNDAFGHQIGDQVLRLVAQSLKDSLKGQDFACRYGGEEFVILLPNTGLDGANKIANILRETIQHKDIRHRKTGEVLSHVTISAGVAELKEDEEIASWIDRADRALYQAKRQGRNQVVVSE